MTQPIEFKVPEGTEDRADKVLSKAFTETSRSLIKKAIEEGKILRQDGSSFEPKTKLRAGEVLRVDLTRPSIQMLEPYNVLLDILFEDKDILVINKPSGMVVHPGDGTDSCTLVHALLHHCPQELCPVGAPNRPGIVHRLDKETSGVMIVAKKESAYHSLVKQFADRKVKKRYNALVVGKLKRNFGSFRESIDRHPKVRVKMTVSIAGKQARTDWEVVKFFKSGFSLIDCDLKTGRTHQIRVHFSNAGNPLVGDVTYGYNPNKYSFKTPHRVMLHAREISFLHPLNLKHLNFHAPIPEDMSKLIQDLSQSG